MKILVPTFLLFATLVVAFAKECASPIRQTASVADVGTSLQLQAEPLEVQAPPAPGPVDRTSELEEPSGAKPKTNQRPLPSRARLWLT